MLAQTLRRVTGAYMQLFIASANSAEGAIARRTTVYRTAVRLALVQILHHVQKLSHPPPYRSGIPYLTSIPTGAVGAITAHVETTPARTICEPCHP